jgi:hypothetical protein
MISHYQTMRPPMWALASRAVILVAASGPATLPVPRAAPASPVADPCAGPAGRTFDVGPGQRLARIGDVPWDGLRAGDRVRIHWRPQPYREKILISGQGTALQPIRVCGVPGPDGALPVIDGRNATTGRNVHHPHPTTQERGLIILSLRAGQPWGSKPRHVAIASLDLRGAHPGTAQAPGTFADEAGGRRRYRQVAAAIFVERAEHVVIRGCRLSESAHGLFVASGDSEQMLSRDILVEGNYIFDNGVAGSDREHNVYTEAIGIVFDHNRFGPLQAGAGGNALKDRSAGTVIRYNWIEGGAHLLDLVEAEESVAFTTKAPGYDQTYVFGNVLVNGPRDGYNLIHFGGDNGREETYRKGPLYFFHNTVFIEGEERTRWHTSLLRLETDRQTADVRNNIIVRAGTTHVYLLNNTGQVRLGPNWISPGIEPTIHGKARQVTGLEQALRTGPPPVASPAQVDLRPRPEHAAAHGGGTLATDLPAAYRPIEQYVRHQQTRTRARFGAGAALGAME